MQFIENLWKMLENIEILSKQKKKLFGNYQKLKKLSESSYHTTKFFTENLLKTEMKKTHILT